MPDLCVSGIIVEKHLHVSRTLERFDRQVAADVDQQCGAFDARYEFLRNTAVGEQHTIDAVRGTDETEVASGLLVGLRKLLDEDHFEAKPAQAEHEREPRPGIPAVPRFVRERTADDRRRHCLRPSSQRPSQCCLPR